MVIIDNLLNYVEVKRWRVFHGVLDEAFVKALLEMQKDLVLLEKAKIANPLAAAPRIRWSFILGVGERGLKLEDLPRLAEQFASRLDDPALRTALESAFRGGPRPAEAVKDAAKAIEEFKTMLRRGQILEGVIG